MLTESVGGVSPEVEDHHREATQVRPSTSLSSIPLRFMRRLLFGAVAIAVLASLAWYSQAYNELLGYVNERTTGLSSVAAPLISRQISAYFTPVPQSAPRDGFLTVKTAVLSVIAQNFATARSQVEQITRQHEGYIAQIAARSAQDKPEEIRAVLRIPATRLDAALEALRQLGRVQEETQAAAEVSEESADIDASLRNAKVLEQRLLDLLRNRTAKIEDVVAAEKELGESRQNIESLERRRANLDQRIQFSSVELLLSEQSAQNSLSVGLRFRASVSSGFHNLAQSLLDALLWLMSFGPVLCVWLAILFWLARFVWRRMRGAMQQPTSA